MVGSHLDASSRKGSLGTPHPEGSPPHRGPKQGKLPLPELPLPPPCLAALQWSHDICSSTPILKDDLNADGDQDLYGWWSHILLLTITSQLLAITHDFLCLQAMLTQCHYCKQTLDGSCTVLYVTYVWDKVRFCILFWELAEITERLVSRRLRSQFSVCEQKLFGTETETHRNSTETP